MFSQQLISIYTEPKDAVLKKFKITNVKIYIRANGYVSDKTNVDSNESILQKKPNESHFQSTHGPVDVLYFF